MPSNKALITSTPNIRLDQAIILAQGDTNVTGSSSTEVFNVLVDTSTWPKWNRVAPYCTIRYQPNMSESPSPVLLQHGTRFSMHVNMSLTSTTTLAESILVHEQGKSTSLHLIVTLFEAPDPLTHKPGRIAWTLDHDETWTVPRWLLRLERMHVFSDEDTAANVNTWEMVASSWAGRVMKWYLRETFEEVLFPAWLGGLKEYSERC